MIKCHSDMNASHSFIGSHYHRNIRQEKQTAFNTGFLFYVLTPFTAAIYPALAVL